MKRLFLFGVFAAGSLWTAQSLTGAPGEAFWLLVPLWGIAGAFIQRSRHLRWDENPKLPAWPFGAGRRAAALAVLLLASTAVYWATVVLKRGRFSWTEWLAAVYFLGGSLGVLLFCASRAFCAVYRPIACLRPRWAAHAGGLAAGLSFTAIIAPLLISTLSLHRFKVLSRPPDPALALTWEDVTFSSRESRPVSLRGSFFSAANPQGTVIACHGLGADRMRIQRYISLLHESGFQVFAFDFRGHGESEGRTITYGDRERLDVLGAWDYVVSRPDVDARRVFALGVSMGAASLLLALPDLPDIRAAVLDSPFADLGDMLRYQYRALPKPVAGAFAGLTEVFGWLETGMWASEVSPARALERIHIPLAFIHGLRDKRVPPSASQRLFEAYHGPKRLRLEPRAAHVGTAACDPLRYREEVRRFFLEARGDEVRGS